MFVTKMALPRRTFLRGVGATLALPLLDAMVPALSALAQTSARPVPRIGFIYTPNGVMQNLWTPAGEGAAFEFSPILSPLAPLRDRVLVVSGLAHRQVPPPAPTRGARTSARSRSDRRSVSRRWPA